MNFIRRGLLSIVRQKGKSIILFTMIFILGNVIAGAVAIKQSTINVEKKVKEQVGATAQLNVDYDNIMSTDTVVKNLTEEQVEKIGNLPMVKEYEYSMSSYMNTKNFKAYSPSFDSDAISVNDQYLILNGTNLTTPLDFSRGGAEITSGRTFTEDELSERKNVAMISEELAKKNDLAVGDQMILDSKIVEYKDNGATEEYDGNDYSVEIIGIYKINSVETKKDDQSLEEKLSQQMIEADQFNTIYMPNGAVKSIVSQEYETGKSVAPSQYEDISEDEYGMISPTYVLNSPDVVEDFKSDASSLVPTGYKLSVSTDQYDQVRN